MELVIWLSAFVYGGDVKRLDDRDYGQRAAAHSRLKESGVWAVPALWGGMRDAKPEAMNRIRILLDRRSEWWYPLVKGAIHSKVDSPELIGWVSQLAVRDADVAEYLFREVDRTGQFHHKNSRYWCWLTPYACQEKTYAGQLAYMIRMVRAKIHAPPVSPPVIVPDNIPPFEDR